MLHGSSAIQLIVAGISTLGYVGLEPTYLAVLQPIAFSMSFSSLTQSQLRMYVSLLTGCRCQVNLLNAWFLQEQWWEQCCDEEEEKALPAVGSSFRTSLWLELLKLTSWLCSCSHNILSENWPVIIYCAWDLACDVPDKEWHLSLIHIWRCRRRG